MNILMAFEALSGRLGKVGNFLGRRAASTSIGRPIRRLVRRFMADDARDRLMGSFQSELGGSVIKGPQLLPLLVVVARFTGEGRLMGIAVAGRAREAAEVILPAYVSRILARN